MATAIPGHQSAFEDDVNAYLKALPGLLSSNKGKFALVGKAQLVSVHVSNEDAMSAGYEQFGLNGFLVQQISDLDLEMGQHWLDESCQS